MEKKNKPYAGDGEKVAGRIKNIHEKASYFCTFLPSSWASLILLQMHAKDELKKFQQYGTSGQK